VACHGRPWKQTKNFQIEGFLMPVEQIVRNICLKWDKNNWNFTGRPA
jgi:hypothetical protein